MDDNDRDCEESKTEHGVNINEVVDFKQENVDAEEFMVTEFVNCDPLQLKSDFEIAEERLVKQECVEDDVETKQKCGSTSKECYVKLTRLKSSIMDEYIRPYVCEMCNKRFIQKRYLKTIYDYTTD